MTSPDVNLRTGMLNGLTSLIAKINGEQYTKTYYVDNVVGSDTANNGLSWTKPFAQLSKAITVWEAFRAVQTNIYAKGLIYVRGTGTAYTKLTALPNYCDIVGVGANPRGNGTGIASITSTTGEDTCDEATGARGLGLFNLQFTGSGTGRAFDAAVLFRSTIENCTFVNKSTGGMRIVKGGGLTIRNCQIGGGDTVSSAIGLENSGTDNFNNCLVEDNVIIGTVDGVIVTAGLCDSTLFRKNFIYGGSGHGVDDNSGATSLVAHAFYVDNMIGSAADGMEMTQCDGTCNWANWVNTNGTTTWEDAF